MTRPAQKPTQSRILPEITGMQAMVKSLNIINNISYARVAELVDALDLGSSTEKV